MKLVYLPAAVCAALLVSTPALRAQTSQHIDEAKAQIVAGDYVNALAAAQDAARASPQDFQAAYYVAMAQLGLRRFNEAKEEANRALSLAPADARGSVEKLVARIAAEARNVDATGKADAALAAGEVAKAAQLYAEASGDGKTSPAAALKAAKIYQDRLGEPVKAAMLYRSILAATPGGYEAEQSTAALASLDKQLKAIAESKVNIARARMNENKLNDAVILLKEASDAYPELIATHAMMMQVFSKYPKSPERANTILSIFKELQKFGPVDVKSVGNAVGLLKYLSDAPFHTSMVNILGVSKVNEISDLLVRTRKESVIPFAQEIVSKLSGWDPHFVLQRVLVSEDGNVVCINHDTRNGFGFTMRNLYMGWDYKRDGWVIGPYGNKSRDGWDRIGCDNFIDVTDRVS